MLKIVIFLGLILVVFSTHAQNSKFFEGKWHCIDFYNFRVKDSAEFDSAKRFYKQYIIVFNSNQQYHVDFWDKEKGTWKYLESSKKIVFIDSLMR